MMEIAIAMIGIIIVVYIALRISASRKQVEKVQ